MRTADLDKVYAAIGPIFVRANVTGMKLEAFKYYYIPANDLGVAGIVARPTPELLKLQQDLIAAVAPFTAETGASAAFVTTADDPIIDPLLIGYVASFVPKASGEHFNPHVSTGVASREYLDKMLAEPFEPFTFAPAGRGGLSAWAVRHGGENAQGVELEAMTYSGRCPKRPILPADSRPWRPEDTANIATRVAGKAALGAVAEETWKLVKNASKANCSLT